MTNVRKTIFPAGHRLAGHPAWHIDGAYLPVCSGGEGPLATGGARLAQIRTEQAENDTLIEAARAEATALADADCPEGLTDAAERAAWDVTQSAAQDAAIAEWDRLRAANTALDTEAAPLQARATRLTEIRDAAATAPATRTATGDGAAGTATERTQHQTTTTRVANSTDDIYDRSSINVLNDSDGRSYRDRALAAIDSWRTATPDQKESAQRLIDDADKPSTPGLPHRDRAVADHILRFGNPTYVSAFGKFMRGGTPILPLLEPDEARAFQDGMAYSRAVNEGSIAAGQAIVPPFLDPTIILTNAGIVNPFRQMARVVSITTQTWKGVTSAGVTAEWTAEAAEMTDASPVFTQPTITPVRADAYIEASFEALEDTALANDIAMLLADARDRLEGAAFAVGTGSTQPTGITTTLGVTTLSQTAAKTNGTISTVDVFNMDSNLPARYRANAQWAASKGILNILRNLAVGPSQQQSAFWVDFGGGIPSKLIGYNVNEASGMIGALSTATASNDLALVLGDFAHGYVIVDRVGMSVAFNPLVVGPNRRPTGSVGWAAFWRTGAGVVNPAAFQVLVV